METYGKILIYAMPAFLAFVLLEKLYGRWKGNDKVPNMDMISSLSSGLTNVTKDVLQISVTIIAYGWLVDKIALWHIPTTIWTYAIVFVVMDFKGYWVHRWSHEINFFWNKHIIHHSSEEFNLACALRQSVSSFVDLFTFFLLPCALLGIEEKVIAIVGPLHLFAQFWYHTQHINKMGFLEHILVTPSHHRVHHAVNQVYMDKNYAQIFIVWDKWFGTFQAEMPEVPPRYGISRPAQTWNPIKINFQHFWLMLLDAWRTQNLWDKCRIWFMPTGWRPDDIKNKFPVAKIEDVYAYEKYHTHNSVAMQTWFWVQFMFNVTLLFYLFGNIAAIGAPYIYFYGVFIFLSIYSYTELMDMNPNAWMFEMIKNIYGFGCIYFIGSWFGIDKIMPFGTAMVLFYLVFAFFMTIFFVVKEIKLNKEEIIA
jgi:alkylglycerol monooxygenase